MKQITDREIKMLTTEGIKKQLRKGNLDEEKIYAALTELERSRNEVIPPETKAQWFVFFKSTTLPEHVILERIREVAFRKNIFKVRFSDFLEEGEDSKMYYAKAIQFALNIIKSRHNELSNYCKAVFGKEYELLTEKEYASLKEYSENLKMIGEQTEHFKKANADLNKEMAEFESNKAKFNAERQQLKDQFIADLISAAKESSNEASKYSGEILKIKVEDLIAKTIENFTNNYIKKRIR